MRTRAIALWAKGGLNTPGIRPAVVSFAAALLAAIGGASSST